MEKIQQARDVTGKMFQAETLNYHEAPQQAYATDPPRPAVKNGPRLMILGPTQMLLTEQSQSFIPSNEGIVGMVVRVENPEVREDRTQAIAAHNVVATVTFSSLDKQLAKIQRAFWLRHFEYEIDIPPGVQECVVIGQYDHGVWKCWNNERRSGLPQHASWRRISNFASALTYPLDEPEVVFLNPCVRADVKIITSEGHFLAAKSFRICTNADNTDFGFEELS